MHQSVKSLLKSALQVCFSSRRFLWRLPKNRQAVALTFDDGPHPVYTPRILDLLRREKCTATFFVIGKNVEKHPALVKRIADEGHTLGVHGYAHREIVGLSAQALANELNDCRRAIYEASGIDTGLFRPPRGRVSSRSILRVMHLGYCLVHWTKTYDDYLLDGTSNLLSRIERDPMLDRDIILLHDDNNETVAALETIIGRYRSKGSRFQAI